MARAMHWTLMKLLGLCLFATVLRVTAQDGHPIPTAAIADNSSTLVYPGDMYIAVFIDLHKSSAVWNGTCDDLNPAAVQQLWATLWAIQTLNNQTELDMPKLGLKVYDTCGTPIVTLRHTMKFLQHTVPEFPGSCEPLPGHFNALGVIGIGEPDALQPTLGLLQAYSVPLVLATPSAASGLPSQPNVLTTAPTMASLVQSVVALLDHVRWKSVYVLSSSPAAVQDLTTVAIGRDLTILQTIVLHSLSLEAIENIMALEKNRERQSPMVIVLMLEASEIERLVQLLSQHRIMDDIAWVLAVPSMDKNQLSKWSLALHRGFLIMPHPLHLQGFQDSFLGALVARERDKPLVIDHYLQKEYQCSGPDGSSSSKVPPCSQLTLADLQRGYRQNPEVPFVSKAVSALAAALRLVQIDRCKLGDRCTLKDLDSGTGPIFADVLSALMKLSFTVHGNEPMEVEGTRLKFTEDGRLLFRHFDIYAFEGLSQPVQVAQVGWYSNNIGLNLNLDLGPRSASIQFHQTLTQLDILETFDKAPTPKSSVLVLRYSQSPLLVHIWATVVVVVAGIGLLTTAYVFVYILMKICDRTLTGNQFLGIALLSSIACLYATCLLFVLPPSEALCNWRLFLHSFGYVLCYGVLLLKVMQLRAVVLLGIGGQPSHVNQALTLFFVVGVQVALNIQWSVLMRPLFGVTQDALQPHCLTTPTDFISLQSYIILLLLITCGYALWTRRIRHNHNEGRWVLLATALSVPAWIAWVTAYLIVPLNYHEAVVCAGLISNASVVFGTFFIPKLRALRRQVRTAHCKASAATSHSSATVFSLTHDLHGSSQAGKPSLPLSLFTESLLQNPLYDFDEKVVHRLPDKK